MQIQGTGLSKEFKTLRTFVATQVIILPITYMQTSDTRTLSLSLKENGVKDYTHSHIVGLNLGYVVYHTENCNIGAQIGYGSNMKRKKQ